MAARIAMHRRERPAHWRVVEEPIRLGQAVRDAVAAATPPTVLLVDCLTLWISNCLWAAAALHPQHDHWQRERADFLAALSECTLDVIIVSNEVGTGIVPDNSAARVFRDEQGWLNQAVAAACDEVFFITAGLPLCLKQA